MNEATTASLTILTGEIINVPVVVDVIDVRDESVCVCVRSLHGTCNCEPASIPPARLLVFPQLGDYISDIASNMMLVEEHILWMAQNEARACTRIVQCVERIADLALTGDNQVMSKVRLNWLTPTLKTAISFPEALTFSFFSCSFG